MTVTWSATDKSANITLSNGNLTAQAATAGSDTPYLGRATAAITSGQKKYFELTVNAVAGNFHTLGLSTAGTTISDGTFFGTSDSTSIGWCNDNELWNASSQTNPFFSTWVDGNILCFAVDRSNNQIWFRVDGGDWNGDSSADPASNVGGIALSMAGDLYPTYGIMYSASVQAEITANFGATSFAQALPSGFTGLDTGGGSVSLSLAATEATDTASFSASLKDSLSLAATEAKDTASFSASLKDVASLAATEAADTASISASLSDDSSLAATEPADTASFSASLSLDLSLDSTEAQDTADFGVDLSDDLALAATEDQDTAAFVLVGDIDAVLDATEATDIAAFTLIGASKRGGAGSPVSRRRKRPVIIWQEIEERIEDATTPEEVIAVVEEVAPIAAIAESKQDRKKLERLAVKAWRENEVAEARRKAQTAELHRMLVRWAEEADDDEEAAIMLLAA